MAQKTSSRWDLSRFWQTITYFEVIPAIGRLQKLFSGTQTKKAYLSKKINMETVLVVGTQGKILQQVIDFLVAQDYRVKVIVRDSEQLKGSIDPNKVEFLDINLYNLDALTPKIIKEVNRIIYIDDSENPEQNRQLISHLQETANSLSSSTDKILFDFTNPTSEIKETWGAVDDVVMGGVSQSNIRLADKKAVFSGVVSTENNGGFASVRTRNFDSPLNLSDYEGIELRLQGDGKRYKFITRCEGKWDGISYCYSFDTVYNYWITIRVPFKELIPVFRAKTVTDAGYFDASKVYSMQLMISKFEYDGALNRKFDPGVFSLEVQYIKAYGGKPKSRFIKVSSTDLSLLKQEFS